jgi:hypothetical protein
MPRVICRCGEKLKVPPESPEHMDCTRCGARIRLRRSKPQGTNRTNDGFLRFLCPCGRRLKVSEESRLNAGKCPDCGRVVPVPSKGFDAGKLTIGRNEADASTEDLDDDERAKLEEWFAYHLASAAQVESDPRRALRVPSDLEAPNDENLDRPQNAIAQASVVKFETGLRVCPRCKKPLHLSADNCRECGLPVPRQ